eukprot:scaffold2724_cov260-Pinguiococcus_pyrenoidosus.AAC.3
MLAAAGMGAERCVAGLVQNRSETLEWRTLTSRNDWWALFRHPASSKASDLPFRQSVARGDEAALTEAHQALETTRIARGKRSREENAFVHVLNAAHQRPVAGDIPRGFRGGMEEVCSCVTPSPSLICMTA